MRPIQQKKLPAAKNKTLTIIFYTYLAALPLLSVIVLYFDKDIWNAYTRVFDDISHTLTLFYHFYSLIILGFSGAAMGVVITNIPIPKNKIWLLLIILSPIISILINNVTGQEFKIAEMLFFTLIFENSAIILAYILLFITSKEKFIVLILLFSGGLLISYFGIYTFNIVKNMSFNTLFSTFANLLFSAFAYYKVIKIRTESNKKGTDLQNKFFIISTFLGITAVMFLILVYILPVFAFSIFR